MRHCWNPLITNDRRHSHLDEALNVAGVRMGWMPWMRCVCCVGLWKEKNFCSVSGITTSPYHFFGCVPMCVSTHNKVQIISPGSEIGCQHFAASSDLSFGQLSSASTTKRKFAFEREKYFASELFGKWIHDTQIEIPHSGDALGVFS